MQIKGLMTSSTQPNFCQVQKLSYLGHFSAETIETCQTNSSTDETPIPVIKLCYHGNAFFSSPHQFVFNILEFFSSEKLNPGKTSAKSIDMLARSCMKSIIYKY